jgi:RNA polymerase-binding transcription factor DksA
MDTIKLGIYQDMLLRRRRGTFSCLKRLEEDIATLAQERQLDWIDQAVDETEIHLVARLNEEHTRELGRIQVALDRIHIGKYGVCRACHQPID